MRALNCLETPEAIEVFRRVFLQGLDLERPVLRPSEIAQWEAMIQSLGLGSLALNARPTLLWGGYFYNFSTPAPDEKTIALALAEARESGATQILMPTVPDEDDATALLAAGFKKIPAMIESLFDLEGDLDSTLRTRLGGKNLGDLRRFARKAEREYEWRFLRQPELTVEPRLLEVAAEVHAFNAEKYHHPRNAYSLPLLRSLLSSEMGDKLLIGLRSERKTGRAVQMIVGVIDDSRGEIAYLAQGVDRGGIPAGQNLYASSFYRVYELAAEKKCRLVLLGRGMGALKKRLGANRFRTLNHWLWCEDGEARREIDGLAKAAAAPIEKALRDLSEVEVDA